MVRGNDGQLRRKFDYDTAGKYGDVVILVPHGQSLVSSVPVVRQLVHQLRNFTQDDHLLPLGDPAIMAAAAAIAAKNSNGVMNVLKWDRREQAYISVPLDISGRTL